MAVYRVDLLTDQTGPVFEWLDAHVEKSELVRSVAYKTVKGWYFKCVFKHHEDAEAFHRRWHPEATDHTVTPFGQPAPDQPFGIVEEPGLSEGGQG